MCSFYILVDYIQIWEINMGQTKHCFMELLPKHNVYYRNAGWKGAPSDNLV